MAEGERRGAIDLARFFSRRIRRLLPAAALVLAATCAAVFYFYAPFEHVPILKSAKATALYYSNVHFAGIALDYHAATDAPNPLLHTWSLAVEEQFYLAWPILVLLALLGWREGPQPPNRRRLIGAVWAVVVLTFGLSIVLLLAGRAHWAFFATQARAWEFGVGALATLIAVPERREAGAGLVGLRFSGRMLAPDALTTALGWAGLGMVLAAGMLYTDRTPFPGWTALLPVVGTALLLRAGARAEGSSLARVLTVRPLQELGRLSYSWYLWHWPVLVIVESVIGTQPLWARLLIGLGTLALSELTYRLVENPVRHARLLAGRPAWGLALLVMLTAGSYATISVWETGTISRINEPGQVRYAAAERDTYEAHFEKLGCALPAGSPSYADCDLGAPDADTTVVYFGDSHAADFHVAMADIAARRGWRLRSFIKPACPPWVAIPFIGIMRRRHTECGPWREGVLRVVAAEQPDLVVIKGADNYQIAPTSWSSAIDSLYERLSPQAGVVVDVRSLPPAEQQRDPAICLARAAWKGRALAECSVPIGLPESWRVRLEAARAYPNVHPIDMLPEVCGDERCPAEIGDVVVYIDRTHLTSTFAQTLARPLEREIEAVLRQARPNGDRLAERRKALSAIGAESE